MACSCTDPPARAHAKHAQELQLARSSHDKHLRWLQRARTCSERQPCVPGRDQGREAHAEMRACYTSVAMRIFRCRTALARGARRINSAPGVHRRRLSPSSRPEGSEPVRLGRWPLKRSELRPVGALGNTPLSSLYKRSGRRCAVASLGADRLAVSPPSPARHSPSSQTRNTGLATETRSCPSSPCVRQPLPPEPLTCDQERVP